MAPLGPQIRSGSRQQLLQAFGTREVRVQGLWGRGATAAPCQGRLAHGSEEPEVSPKESCWGVSLLQVTFPFRIDLDSSWERKGCEVRDPGWGSLHRPSILPHVCPLPRSSFAPPKLLGPSPCPHPSVPVSRDSREFAPFGPLQGPSLSPAPCPRHRSRTSLGSPGWEVAGPQEKTRRKSPRRAGAARRPPAASASSTSPRPRPAPRPRPHGGPSRAVNPLVAAPDRASPRG